MEGLSPLRSEDLVSSVGLGVTVPILEENPALDESHPISNIEFFYASQFLTAILYIFTPKTDSWTPPKIDGLYGL